MAKAIVVERDGETSTFAFSKIDRSKLYGRRRRVALDPSGQPCTRAALNEDGSLILRQGMTAQGYFDDTQRWVPQAELVGLDPAGEALAVHPSTLGEEVPLGDPIDVREFLEVRVQSVYALDPEGCAPGLRADLESGKIFRFPFNYRPGWDSGFGYLVANMEGLLFAVVGARVEPEWCSPNVLPELGEDEDFSDELDFEMF